ncbi:MAG: phosphomethylpyrimidine synthase ThiC [Nitrospirae bacterium]|uniref:phosphomethylpyrimidine synthase ThiC n=1 Tax=Candidatus Magnetobacterium casense TaxID=1455061 RepID=UPI00058C5572|nr:phosphomethylpyrimidine synthase ThiC [Candidatus Magnetobacterium casensis]MBF0338611.1 phosphomethylpyrimidine synthase ThiC [Nitrospirota bacterium]
MTQIERALRGEITEEVKTVTANEKLDVNIVARRVASGKIVIPCNSKRTVKTIGIGKGLKTKVNASIGTSTDIIDTAMEIEKARTAEKYGADTIMDLSVGGNITEIRKAVMDSVTLPLGTVPLYEAFAVAAEGYGSITKMTEELLWEIIERQCEEGVSFMAVHCGINRLTLEVLKKQHYRYGGLVSKGGACMVAWMQYNDKENPLYAKFDRVAEILNRHDVVLSLGNGFRAGAIHDATDRVAIQELIINCEFAEIGRTMGCQTMVEGPGHIPINEIEANIILAKKMSAEASFYMLGPITTDIAPGYDHITSAVGAALSASYGADFLCYVTPAEHLGLPFAEDVREGVIAAKIAAHIGDMVKLSDTDRDKTISKARRDMDWSTQFKLAIDPERAVAIRDKRNNNSERTCTMCGNFCANGMLQGMFEKHTKTTDKE